MTTTDYRATILEIANQYSRDGDDWELNLLAGGPQIVDRAEALRIAAWLDDEADGEWGADARHQEIAAEIRAAVAA